MNLYYITLNFFGEGPRTEAALAHIAQSTGVRIWFEPEKRSHEEGGS